MSFVVKGIPKNISNTVREEMVSPQYRSLPAFSALANGYGPCRSCLCTFNEGKEDRTSFTYDPVDGVLDLPQPGPVFIHTFECERYECGTFPPGIRGVPVYLEAFDKEGFLKTRTLADDDSEDDQINALLSEPAVEFLHIRNSEAGCFIARVERS